MGKTTSLFILLFIIAFAGCYKSINTEHDAADSASDPVVEDSLPDTSSPDIPPDIIPEPYCYSNEECGTGEFCEFEPGMCAGSGRCMERGGGECEEIYFPECGCDGNTYSNDCYRRFAGVSLRHYGECGSEACYPYDPYGVCDEWEFCEGPPDYCDVDGAAGWCEPVPDGCPHEYVPVCGCDRVTYANNCRRKQEGAWLDYEGECGGGACYSGDPYNVCDEGEFCEAIEGMCYVLGATGWCQVPDDSCGRLYDPVCGCDGETYPNDCVRQQEGVWRDYRGPCDEPPPPDRICGPGLDPCPVDNFCEYPPGDCGWSFSSRGICILYPGECPSLYDPVCGCDGSTYSNDCVRQSEGVSLNYRGECGP